jgi:hypothetical protein
LLDCTPIAPTPIPQSTRPRSTRNGGQSTAFLSPSPPIRVSAKIRYYADTEDFLWKKLVPLVIERNAQLNPLNEAMALEWAIQTRNDRSSRRRRNEENLKCVFPPVLGTYVATSTKCDGMSLL